MRRLCWVDTTAGRRPTCRSRLPVRGLRTLDRRGSASRGFTLVETLAGLIILTLIITTSLAVFYGRQLRLRRAEETIVAYQLLAVEAELQRRVPFAALLAGRRPFLFQSELRAKLEGIETSVEVESQANDVKILTLSIHWKPDRNAQLVLVRSNTGGGNLF